MEIDYDLAQLSYAMLEEVLQEVGLTLDNTLLAKLKRAIIQYTEETEMQNDGLGEHQGDATRQVFANRYHHRPHGCRDCRPEHLRRYL